MDAVAEFVGAMLMHPDMQCQIQFFFEGRDCELVSMIMVQMESWMMMRELDDDAPEQEVTAITVDQRGSVENSGVSKTRERGKLDLLLMHTGSHTGHQEY